jgi:predicted DCC family thiol-disulfide oxidoreductase YuxK
MMNKLTRFLKASYNKKIDGTGLAIFRILYAIILLCEIAHMYYFRHFMFDKIPYIDLPEINFAIPISIWFISVLFILFGSYTRFFCIINYIMSLIFIGSIRTFEYHVFYMYMGINFFLIFIPISQCLSLDRLFTKLKYSNTTFNYTPSQNVSQLYYLIIPFIGIGLVYFDSIFIKFGSHTWLSGLGLWLPGSMPMMVHNNLTFLLNQKYLMIFLGYFTLFFETIFLFIFFRKKWRIFTFIIGFILHVGILILWPIPLFALTNIILYLLLLPVSFWKNFFSCKKESNSLIFYYDSECPLCIRTKIVITHLDWFNKIGFKTVQFDAKDDFKLKGINYQDLLNDIYSVNIKGNVFSGVDTYIQVMKRIFFLYPIALFLKLPGIYQFSKRVYNYMALNRNTERCTEENCGYNPPIIQDDNKIKILKNFTVLDLRLTLLKYILVAFFFLQLFMIYDSPLINQGKEIVSFNNTKVDKFLTLWFARIRVPTKVLLGITPHNVFVDPHYIGYSHIIAIIYLDKNGKEIWLPIIDKNGQPSYYNYGTNWRKMSFSTNGPNISPNSLNSGVRDYTAFWAKKQNLDLTKAKFLIKVKKIDSLKNWSWEKDFLNRQIAKPWIDGGFIEWKDKKFVSSIKDIESL